MCLKGVIRSRTSQFTHASTGASCIRDTSLALAIEHGLMHVKMAEGHKESAATGPRPQTTIRTSCGSAASTCRRWLRVSTTSSWRQHAAISRITPHLSYREAAARAITTSGDGNNLRPSLGGALGKSTGGQLSYWPDDNGQGRLENLSAEDDWRLQNICTRYRFDRI